MPVTWLTKNEQSALARLRAPARQRQWLSGRWLSKQLLSQAIGVESMREMEVVTRDSQGLGICPQVRVAGRPWRGSLSISHTSSGVLVGLSLDENRLIGVDLACNVPSDERFRSLWFTKSEQLFIAAHPVKLTTLLWGLKEAVFKACAVQGGSHNWTPTQIEIHPVTDDCFEATFFGNHLGQLELTLQRVARGLAVVVSLPRHVLTAYATSPTEQQSIPRRRQLPHPELAIS